MNLHIERALTTLKAGVVSGAAIARRTLFTSWKQEAYDQTQEIYDRIAQGGDHVNRAPPLSGQPLMYVEPADHEELRSRGAQERNGQWFIAPDLEDEQLWQFSRWFAKAAPDLVAKHSSFLLTVDGKSTNSYIHPHDTWRGNDSTATALIMGAIAVSSTLAWALSQIPRVGVLLALLVGGSLVIFHSLVLLKAEGSSTLKKVLALALLLPFVAGALTTHSDGALSFQTLWANKWWVVGGLVMATWVFMSSSLEREEELAQARSMGLPPPSPIVSTLGNVVRGFVAVGAVLGVNIMLSLLPSSLSILRPMGWYVIACSYPLWYAWSNKAKRVKEMKANEMAGAGTEGGSEVGPLAPARLQQIREAARDDTPLIPVAVATGVMSGSDLPAAPDPYQTMCLSLRDLATHLMVFGETGAGKTGQLLRPMALRLKTLPQKIGAILTDGKGAMVEDMRPFLDIIIEPGIKFAPIQGMSAQMVANALAEAHGYDSSDESIWQDGANAFNRFAWAILEALVAHEKNSKVEGERRLLSYEHQLDYLLADREQCRRRGQDVSYVDNLINQLKVSIQSTQEFIASTRQFQWTWTSFARIKNMLAQPVMGRGNVMYANQETLKLFEFLGYPPFVRMGDEDSEETKLARAAHDLKKMLRPATIFRDLQDSGRVLSRAIEYFLITWPNTDEKQRSSFLINVDRDIVGFFQNDEMRGSMIDGVDHGDTAWADTEEGVDIMGVLYGKWLGINLPENQYGHTGKVIAKLVKARIFKEVMFRTKLGEGGWVNAGQTPIVDMCDECQELVSPLEMKLSSMTRSLGLYYVYATQKYEGLSQTCGGDTECDNFLGNFLSVVSFKTSERTYQYLQKRVGVAKKKMVTFKVQATLDTDRAIDMFYKTGFSDPNHPHAHLLKDLDHRGATRFQPITNTPRVWGGLASKAPVSMINDPNYIPVNMDGKYETAPILEDWQITNQLEVAGTAIVILKRARHSRIDYATTTYMSVPEVEAALAAHRAKSQQAA